MADNSGGNTGLALIVGGLAVLVALFWIFGAGMFRAEPEGPDLDVQIEAPQTPAGGQG